MTSRLGLVSALLILPMLGFAIPAGANFTYVRSIPAPDVPYLPDCLAGLDHTQTSLMVISTYVFPHDSAGGSFVLLVDPLTGVVERQEELPGAPILCESNFYQISSCACQQLPGEGGDYYWVGDACGEVDGFSWPDSINVEGRLSLPGALTPISLATAGESLLVLDEANRWVIARYWRGETPHADTMYLASGPAFPAAITVWRDHLLVSGYPGGGLGGPTFESAFALWEYTMDGDLVGTHIVQSPGAIWPNNITFFDGNLYVAGLCADSIRVFEPTIFNSEVPAGDSVVVEVIPEKVEVTFDSVSTGGWLSGETGGSDPCPPPDGVALFSEFYHLATDAHFDYAAQVVVSTLEALPPGVEARLVRVFVRPSGDCQAYRDITIAPTELPTTLMAMTRTKSEDDEFSVFALGQDHRPPRAVIELKFEILEGTIDADQDSIPPDPRLRIRNLLNASRGAYYRGRSALAAACADSIAITARSVPQIPHVYDPDLPGQNLAGRLISDAHTLAFSLRFSESEALLTGAFLVPEYLDDSPDGFIRAYLDVPGSFAVAEVDPGHIYIEHQVQAIPESTSVAWYPTGKLMDVRRVRTVFRADEIAAVLPPGGATTVRLTCFISGFEVFSDPRVFGPGAGVRDVIAGAVPRLVVKSDPAGSSFGFEVSSGGKALVDVRIYSVRGELVKTLSAGQSSSGTAVLTWHGDNAAGLRVSPGAYFVVVRLAGGTLTRKVVLRH